MGARTPSVAIIIISWNTRDLLRTCLESLQRAAVCESVEVLVVDNGSVDGSSVMCEAVFPWVLLIRNGANLGYGVANNLGIGSTKAEFCLLLNSDTIVEPNARSEEHT